jgi:heme/copper-type cytochrome/quinol oxidase subunit 2
MNSIWWSVLGGLLLGGIVSILFGVYNRKGADSLSRSFLGMSTSVLITDIILIVVVTSFAVLATVSAFVRDLTYPVKTPVNFTIETLLMAFLPSLIIFAMTLLRGYKITGETFEEFGLLVVKFGILHVLLQFSGFYSYVFPPK